MELNLTVSLMVKFLFKPFEFNYKFIPDCALISFFWKRQIIVLWHFVISSIILPSARWCSPSCCIIVLIVIFVSWFLTLIIEICRMPIRSRKTLFKVFVIIVSNWTERCLTAQSVLKTKQRFTKMETPEVCLVIGVANPRIVSRMRLCAQLHAALFHMLCFFYQDPRSVIMLRLATHKLHSLC